MRRAIATAALVVVVVGPASALASPYLTLAEAWVATMAAVEHRYHQRANWSVGNVISPRTDCHRNGPSAVDCGFELVLSAGKAGYIKLCAGTMRLRMGHHDKIIATVKRRPTCKLYGRQG